MSPEDNNGNRHLDDHILDAAIREAMRQRGDAADRAPLDPDTVLRYLAGEASEPESARIQQMLATSPARRQELLEMAVDLEQLESPAVAAAVTAEPETEAPPYAEFIAEQTEADDVRSRPRRAHVEDRPSLWESIRAFFEFRRPMYAMAALYVVTLAMLAYPAYRYLTIGDAGPAGPGGEIGLVMSRQSVSVRPEMRLRGEPPPPPLEISLAEAGAVFELTLQTPHPLKDNQRLQLVVADAGQVLWQSDDFQDFEDTAPGSIRLLLNAERLSPGKVTVTATRFDRTSGAQILAETYNLLFR
ncbi:MAG: hypothetical protein ABIF77_05330 [bacterium]